MTSIFKGAKQPPYGKYYISAAGGRINSVVTINSNSAVLETKGYNGEGYTKKELRRPIYRSGTGRDGITFNGYEFDPITMGTYSILVPINIISSEAALVQMYYMQDDYQLAYVPVWRSKFYAK
jgi:hypothetical protein